MEKFTISRFVQVVIALAAMAAFFFFPRRFQAAPVVIAAVLDSRKGLSRAEQFMLLPPDDQRQRLGTLTEKEKLTLKFDWGFWGRPNQQLPPGADWQTWMPMAGRGWGKTRTGAETVRLWVRGGKFNLVNIIAPTADDARDVCVEGPAGILAICPNRERPEYQKANRKLLWPNGATSLIFTADEPERLRGKQHQKLWCDELAAWRYLEEAWTQAMLGLRLGDNPQAVVTTTPKPLPTIKELVAASSTYLTLGTTYDNRKNLAAAFYGRIITKYEGTRLGRQELNAELLEDRPGALWTRKLIDETRIKNVDKFWKEIYPTLVRLVGALDPATTSTDESDEWGVVFAGRDDQTPPHFYAFEDRSDVYTPDAAAKAAVTGYHQFKCDRIVGEANNGGDMIEALLRHVDPNVSYRKVYASRGKITRAEPISALYEQRRFHHVGNLGTLEDQMCDYDPATANFSPDRMDALVWAGTELSEGLEELGMLGYFADGQAQRELSEMESSGADKLAKVSVARTLAKPATNDKTPGCPDCGAALLQDVPGGQKRCQSCGAQWWPNGTAPAVFRGESRSTIVAGGGGRRR